MNGMAIARGIEQEYAVTGRDEEGGGLLPRVAVQRALDGMARTELVLDVDWNIVDEIGNLGYEHGQLEFWDPDLHRRPVLKNGMRAYDDTGHVEIATPVYSRSADAYKYDRVADVLAYLGTVEAVARFGGAYFPYKLNTSVRPVDHGFEAVAFGTHHNLALSRQLPSGHNTMDAVAQQLSAYFASRPFLTGSGGMLPVRRGDSKILWSNGRLWGDQLNFVMSPRGGFIRELVSPDTTVDRAMVNTRDEPHADPGQFIRFHDINLDAVRAPYQVLLRDAVQYGVFSALMDGRLTDAPALEYVPQAFKDVSFEIVDARIPLADGRQCHPIRDLLVDFYLPKARESMEQVGDSFGIALIDEAFWVCEQLLDQRFDDLEWLLDWCTKRFMIGSYGLSDMDALTMCNQFSLLDAPSTGFASVWPGRELAAASLDGDSLYDPSRAVAAMSKRLGAESTSFADEWQPSVVTGPQDTRDHVRTRLLSQFESEIESVSWSRIYLKSGSIIDLPDPASVLDPSGRLV